MSHWFGQGGHWTNLECLHFVTIYGSMSGVVLQFKLVKVVSLPGLEDEVLVWEQSNIVSFLVQMCLSMLYHLSLERIMSWVMIITLRLQQVPQQRNSIAMACNS
jgi:hypothetical protein